MSLDLLGADPSREISASFGGPQAPEEELGFDDAGLIEAYLAGNLAAYGELVRRHQIALFRLLLGLLADEDLAEAACEEVFLVAERRLPELADPGAFYHWLLGLAREVSLQFNDRQATRVTAEPRSADPRARLKYEIHAVLQQLAPDLRLVLVLTELRGAPEEDVAAALGCDTAEVPPLVDEARTEFTRLLDARASAHPPTPKAGCTPGETPPPLSAGELFGDYRILRPLASGGMGAVYVAQREGSATEVALKIMLPGLGREETFRRRFAREIEAIQRSDHENFVRILDHNHHGETPFLVMELLDGCPLEQLYERGRPLAPARVLGLLRGLLHGLIHAHGAGVIHRDLKPANVFVVDPGGPRERIKILDLGLAKIIQEDDAYAATLLTERGMLFGTPAYMAPEQALGEEVDHRADLYACAVILFQLLAGRLPFESGSPAALLVMQVSSAPPDLAEVAPHLAGSGLAEVVARGLAKAPEDRFASADALLSALDACTLRDLPEPAVLADRSGPGEAASLAPTLPSLGLPSAAPPPATPTAASPERRRWGRWGLARALLIVCFVIAGLGLAAALGLFGDLGELGDFGVHPR